MVYAALLDCLVNLITALIRQPISYFKGRSDPATKYKKPQDTCAKTGGIQRDEVVEIHQELLHSLHINVAQQHFDSRGHKVGMTPGIRSLDLKYSGTFSKVNALRSHPDCSLYSKAEIFNSITQGNCFNVSRYRLTNFVTQQYWHLKDKVVDGLAKRQKEYHQQQQSGNNEPLSDNYYGCGYKDHRTASEKYDDELGIAGHRLFIQIRVPEGDVDKMTLGYPDEGYQESAFRF